MEIPDEYPCVGLYRMSDQSERYTHDCGVGLRGFANQEVPGSPLIPWQ